MQTRSNYRFTGLSLSSNGLREYVSQYGLDFPVYSDPMGATDLCAPTAFPVQALSTRPTQYICISMGCQPTTLERLRHGSRIKLGEGNLISHRRVNKSSGAGMMGYGGNAERAIMKSTGVGIMVLAVWPFTPAAASLGGCRPGMSLDAI
jgi:hypothetical protein